MDMLESGQIFSSEKEDYIERILFKDLLNNSPSEIDIEYEKFVPVESTVIKFLTGKEEGKEEDCLDK